MDLAEDIKFFFDTFPYFLFYFAENYPSLVVDEVNTLGFCI